MEIINDDVYKKWLEICIKSATGTEKVKNALGKIVFGLAKHKAFLDIGAGDGALTLSAAKFFEHSSVIDPNKKTKSVFEGRGIEFIEGYFENIDLGSRTFDFILCSHVFWLVKRENQANFIKKMYKHLSKNGKLAIIMISPFGQSHEFHKKFFFGYDTTTHDILKDLHLLGLPAEVIPVSFAFKTKSFEDFFNICKLFTLQSWLHPVNISNDKIKNEIGDVEKYTEQKLREISKFIKDNCYHNGEYVMEQEDDILVVERIK